MCKWPTTPLATWERGSQKHEDGSEAHRNTQVIGHEETTSSETTSIRNTLSKAWRHGGAQTRVRNRAILYRCCFRTLVCLLPPVSESACRIHRLKISLRAACLQKDLPHSHTTISVQLVLTRNVLLQPIIRAQRTQRLHSMAGHQRINGTQALR